MFSTVFKPTEICNIVEYKMVRFILSPVAITTRRESESEEDGPRIRLNVNKTWKHLPLQRWLFNYENNSSDDPTLLYYLIKLCVLFSLRPLWILHTVLFTRTQSSFTIFWQLWNKDIDRAITTRLDKLRTKKKQAYAFIWTSKCVVCYVFLLPTS